MQNMQSFLKEFDTTNHVMIDIETFAKSQNAVIPQISAVQFNPYTGETFARFDMKIDVQSMLDAGLVVDASTLSFWFEQSKEAIDYVLNAPSYQKYSILIVLQKFKEFLQHCSKSSDFIDTRIWGNGPSFDCSKIASAYQLLKLPTPWKYFNERCVRTIVAFEPSFKKNLKFEGIKHDGTFDCLHQIKFVNQTLLSISNPSDEMLQLVELGKAIDQLRVEFVSGPPSPDFALAWLEQNIFGYPKPQSEFRIQLTES